MAIHVAIGQRPDWDDEVLTQAFAVIRVQLPAQGRVEQLDAAIATLPDELGPFRAPSWTRPSSPSA